MAHRCYSVAGTRAPAASPGGTAVSIDGETTVRPEIYDVLMSCLTDQQDLQVRWQARRHTGGGSPPTAFTPLPLDDTDGPSAADANITYTAEPTYTALNFLLDLSVNARNTYRWVSSPGGELMIPASASNGIGFIVIHTTTSITMLCTVHFRE